MLGGAPYPQIAKKQPETAGMITNMVLDIDNAEQLYLLANTTSPLMPMFQ
ncbi:uncharacterized protein MELLADRAFT_90919 [Melampsora larici-populina 98AG31]|uniref:PABC domain-containing protein n=1 Tax=Melampsora larici-populina (strain 98AG31 / pathotype 3-4-7) TaxID=747676 RepID=F4R814_MELLP|nr:uncharacterized protein MELLADRAFT_90919 [Melampsora larici-populina 98AG31]EGG11693.1 hypothetical protein MELLADRAFT_90919 [Melampsora larici-populina 98AG31]